MIPDIDEHFPDYATLHQATISLEEMGERTITTQVKIDGDITPDFVNDEWWLEYHGEKFILGTHTPQATKDTTTSCSLIDLTFESEPIAKLQQYFFVKMHNVAANTPVIDKFVCPLRLSCSSFIAYFNDVLKFYFGDTFTIDAASGALLPSDIRDINIDYTYLWEALSLINSVYEQTWHIEPTEDGYQIIVGAAAETITDHVFQYGYAGGLQKIERQIEDAEIYNQLFGRGGTKNLPFRYFKKADPDNPAFAGDPDACAELENMYFDRLMDSNFRYYVKGWLRNSHRHPTSDYPTPSTPEPAEVQNHWAYQKGLTDTKFDPVEYVQDLESISEYGIRQGKLDDNDDIFPTIQGVNPPDDSPDVGLVDEIVAVGPITDEDDSGAIGGVKEQILFAGRSVTTLAMNYDDTTGEITDNDTNKRIVATSDSFRVEEGFWGRIESRFLLGQDTSGTANPTIVTMDRYDVFAVDASTEKEYAADTSIPGGADYYLRVISRISITDPERKYCRAVGLDSNIKLISTRQSSSGGAGYAGVTFNIWVKNIWGSIKGEEESAVEYANRVWGPILGDRYGNEAKVVFSSGAMAASSDWDFVIADIPTYDTSQSGSHWRISLGKSAAEQEATGKLIPNSTSAKPVAGDHFFFVGIDMPHNYVEWAEKRLNQTKSVALNSRAYSNPTWAVQLDNVRINTLEDEEEATLASRLNVGTAIKIYDPRFTDNQELTLTIRTINTTWTEGTVMKPTVEIILSEKVLARTLVGRRLSISDLYERLQEATKKTQVWISHGAYDPNHLSKTQEDTAYGKMHFAAGATFGDFISGLTGSGAKIDETGHGEFDSLSVRKFLEVPELRYNRVDIEVGHSWRAPGGGLIDHVEVDYSGDTPLTTGTIHLKLEDGEVASIALNDLCMGIFHNTTGNATADSDDSKGNFHFAGFSTVYFRVTELLAADGHIFKYSLRPTASPSAWSESHHPQAAMTFVAYGNTNDATRQTSRYSTRTYERYLKGVNQWDITKNNIAAQFGDLSNLTALEISGMSGYSAYLENIYMTGNFKQTSGGPAAVVDINTGGVYALKYGQALDLLSVVKKGFDEIPLTDIASWSITRDSGDAIYDLLWSTRPKVVAFDGDLVISHAAADDDLDGPAESTVFTVTATLTDGTTATGVVAIARLRDGDDGDDGVMMVLDAYSGAIIYDREGGKVSNNVVINASIRKGGADVPLVSVSNWSYTLNPANGCTVNRSDNVFTISGIAANVGQCDVIISGRYDNVTYTAKCTVYKLLIGDTYDIIATPTAVTYNSTTQQGSANSVIFEIYKNSQAADGTATRTLLATIDSSKYVLMANGSDVTSSYSSSKYTYSISNYGIGAINVGLWTKKNNAADKLLSNITVPISVVENGAEGAVGVTYRVTTWKPNTLYRNDVADPPSGTVTQRIIDIVTNKDAALLSDPDLIIKQAKKTFTSGNSITELDVPSSQSLIWGDINQLLQPVATPMLLANQITANIIDVDSLSAKMLTIKDSSDNVYAKIGDASYPLWVGGATAGNALTSIDAQGVIRTGAIIASGANSGLTSIIGAFSIDSNGNLNSTTQDTDGRTHTVALRSDRLLVAAAKLGVSGAYRIVAGMDAGEYIDDSYVTAMSININRYSASGRNTALSIKSSLAAVNRGIDIEADDYAIWCERGAFAGLRPASKTLDVSGSATLAVTDFTVVVNNAGALTLNVPSAVVPQNGQTYLIYHLNSTTLTISKGSGSYSRQFRFVDNTTLANSFTSTQPELIMITKVADFGSWIVKRF